MTPARVRAVVKKVRLDPGWSVRVDHAGDVEVVADVADAWHPRRKPVDKPHAYVVNPTRFRSTFALLSSVFDAYQRLKFHECGEWFRYRGRRPFLSGH